jgi:hypothetical protein
MAVRVALYSQTRSFKRNIFLLGEKAERFTLIQGSYSDTVLGLDIVFVALKLNQNWIASRKCASGRLDGV